MAMDTGKALEDATNLAYTKKRTFFTLDKDRAKSSLKGQKSQVKQD